MVSALLSDFDRLSPAQRATVDHWIIDDPDHQPAGRSLDFDIQTERREGWAYQPEGPKPL